MLLDLNQAGSLWNCHTYSYDCAFRSGKNLVVRRQEAYVGGRMLTMAHDVMTDDGSSRVSIIKCLYFSFLGVCVQSK